MKTFTAIAALAAASTVQAGWSADFMQGAQTGFFLTSEEQFEDYQCETARPSQKMQTYLDMAKPMQMMLQNMNKGKDGGDMPGFDLALEAVQAIGVMQTLFADEYDGGEFCQGLLFSKEASKIVFKLGKQLMNKKAAPAVADDKKLSLESKLQ